MLLTLGGFATHIEWCGVVAFTLQAELLLTGIVGWCPVTGRAQLRIPIARRFPIQTFKTKTGKRKCRNLTLPTELDIN